MCVVYSVLEMIISEQMNKLTATIRGIQSISSEERMAASRLSKLMTEEERRERSPLRNVVGCTVPHLCLVVLSVHTVTVAYYEWTRRARAAVGGEGD